MGVMPVVSNFVSSLCCLLFDCQFAVSGALWRKRHRRDAAVIRMRIAASPAGAPFRFRALPDVGRLPLLTPAGPAALFGALRASARRMFCCIRLIQGAFLAPVGRLCPHRPSMRMVLSCGIAGGSSLGVCSRVPPPALDNYIIGGGPYINCPFLPAR